LEVFKEFLANGKVDNVCVDADNPDPLIHLLDSVVIKLEGGTDYDLTVLKPEETLKPKQQPESENKESVKKIEYGTLLIHLTVFYIFLIKYNVLQ